MRSITEEPEATSDPHTLDPRALDRLREWGGDKLANQMVRLFLKNSGVRMDQIRTGAEEADMDEAERGAHSLKSSAANIGAEYVRALATQVEAAALEQDVDGVRETLEELEIGYASAMDQLRELEKGMTE